MRLLNRLLKSVGLLANYARRSLHEFMTCSQSTFCGKETSKKTSNRMHQNPIFNSSKPERDRKEQREVTARYTSIKKLLVEEMEKPGDTKYGTYRTVLDMSVQRIATVMHLEE